MTDNNSVPPTTELAKDYDPKFQYYDLNKGYDFPHRHLTYFDENGAAATSRALNWGLEYLCYISHVHEIVKALTPTSVLDIGCGDGYFVGHLQYDNLRRVGVDLSPKAIGFAKAFFPDFEFYNLNAAELNEQFDVTVAIEVLEHIPDEGVKFFLETMNARTKDGGHAIICVPSTFYPPARLSSAHYRHYNEQVFRDGLEAANTSFEIVKVEYVYRFSRFFNLLLRALINTRWTIDFKFLRKWIWEYLWNNLRYAGAEDGLHLVVTMRKTASQPTSSVNTPETEANHD